MYAQLDTAVVRLVERFGREVSLRRPRQGGTYSISTGRVTGATPLVWSGTGFDIYFDSATVNGTTIRQGDKRVVVKASGLTYAPQAGDRIDDAFEVVNVRTIQPNGEPIAYDCHVRG